VVGKGSAGGGRVEFEGGKKSLRRCVVEKKKPTIIDGVRKKARGFM